MTLDTIVTLPCRPAAGLIPRGLVGSSCTSGTTWRASRGDITRAHRMHLQAAAALRSRPALCAEYLQAAAQCRQLLSAPRWYRLSSPTGNRVQGVYTWSEAHRVVEVLERSSNYSGWTLHTVEES